MLNRLLRVPLNFKNYKKELDVIIQIAVSNGFNAQSIYKMLGKKQKKLTIQSIFPMDTGLNNEVQNWRKIPYLTNISDKLLSIFKKANVRPTFSNKYTLKHMLVNTKKTDTNINKLDLSGVYKINCGDCPAVYIGKTKRSLKIRFNEHLKSTKLENPNSGLAKHLKTANHNCTDDRVVLLHNLRGGTILDTYEILEIRKAKNDGDYLVNDQIDFKNKSPLLDPKLFSENTT